MTAANDPFDPRASKGTGSVIRQLRHGDAIPEGEPRRSVSDAGYIRLRWRIGTELYAEALEHRVVMGLPDGEVHHKDGDKTNNDPENLEVTTKAAHAKLHAEAAKANAKRATEWDGERSQSAYDKKQRRLVREAARQVFVARVLELHAQGLTTIEIGQRVGRHSSGISRIVRGLQ